MPKIKQSVEGLNTGSLSGETGCFDNCPTFSHVSENENGSPQLEVTECQDIILLKNSTSHPRKSSC